MGEMTGKVEGKGGTIIRGRREDERWELGEGGERGKE